MSMVDVPRSRIVVDADRAFPAHRIEGKRCDYILFALGTAEDVLLTAPMELKSGGVDISEAGEQLQAGASFADRFTSGNVTSRCRPILFHGRRIHRTDRDRLNRIKIRFRGRNLTIKTQSCGRPKNLALALRE